MSRVGEAGGVGCRSGRLVGCCGWCVAAGAAGGVVDERATGQARCIHLVLNDRAWAPTFLPICRAARRRRITQPASGVGRIHLHTPRDRQIALRDATLSTRFLVCSAALVELRGGNTRNSPPRERPITLAGDQISRSLFGACDRHARHGCNESTGHADKPIDVAGCHPSTGCLREARICRTLLLLG